MKWDEQAEILRRRAADDEFTLRKLSDDPQSPDWVIGFHAQQAVEKLFKMVLNLHHVRYNRTHKLSELIAALEAAKIVIPDEVREAEILSPYAVEFRYDDPVIQSEPLDRKWVADIVNCVRVWAATHFRRP